MYDDEKLEPARLLTTVDSEPCDGACECGCALTDPKVMAATGRFALRRIYRSAI